VLVGDKTRQTKTREQEQQRRLTVVGAAVGALVTAETKSEPPQLVENKL
jgi:hypothetical protein